MVTQNKSKGSSDLFYLHLYGVRLVNAMGGLLSLALVAALLDGLSAGYFYFAISLISLNALFELGLSTLIVQRASVITRHASWSSTELDLNYAIIRPAFQHYFALLALQAIVMVACLYPAGVWLLGGSMSTQAMGSLAWVWLATCLIMGINVLLAFSLNFLDGLGQIKDVARIRLVQAISSQVALNVGLLCGLGYASLTLQLIVTVLVGIGLLRGRHGMFLRGLLVGARLRPNLHLIRTDWQLQWRLTLSFLSGYFSNQAWVVAISLAGNVALAGRAGMALQLVTAGVGFAMTPIGGKMSIICALAHRAASAEYFALVGTQLRHALIVLLSIAIASVAGYLASVALALPLLGKLISPGALLWMFLAAPFVFFHSALTLLNQSLGRDDLYVVSVFKIACLPIALMLLGARPDEQTFAMVFALVAIASAALAFALHQVSLRKVFA